MKAYTILAFAVLIAAAAADFNHLASLNQALSATDCSAQENGFVVDFAAVPAFDGTVDVTDAGVGHTSYKVTLSACQPMNVSGCAEPVFVYVEHGLYQACYSTPPALVYNSTSNLTTAVFQAPTTLKRSLLLEDNTAYALSVEYKCSVTQQIELASMGGAIVASTMALSFSTNAACASRVLTTEAPTTTAPQGTPAPEDDKKGLSSWVIVVIIVAAVVAIVAVAVGCWKCRSSKKEQSDGVYSQV